MAETSKDFILQNELQNLSRLKRKKASKGVKNWELLPGVYLYTLSNQELNDEQL